MRNKAVFFHQRTELDTPSVALECSVMDRLRLVSGPQIECSVSGEQENITDLIFLKVLANGTKRKCVIRVYRIKQIWFHVSSKS